MRRQLLILHLLSLLMLALALSATASQAEWRMRIHRGTIVDDFMVSSVDSVTFHFVEDSTSVPNVMVTVPSGTFTMGDGMVLCGEDQHEVTLTRDFELSQHEVTNLQYLEIVQWAYDRGYVDADTTSVWDALDGSQVELLDLDVDFCEIQFDGAGSFYIQEATSTYAQQAYPGGYDPTNHPVKAVTWHGAVRYCDWLSLRTELPRAYAHSGDWSCNGGDPYGAIGYRLPTDAEWEYAAQWNDDRIYPWGNEDPDCGRTNFASCIGWTTPVGSYPDGPESLGLSDMAGNLGEWCNDWSQCSLGTAPVTDPTGPAVGSWKIHHGGAWNSPYFFPVHRAYRDGALAAYGNVSIGFRVARTLH